MSGADEAGKLFIGGLSWATTSETMETYFSKFGRLSECVVMCDKVTGDSRGFGFVRFEDPQCVAQVLKTRPHILNDKQVDPKPCTPKDEQIKKKEAERLHITTHKIFIGGLPRDATEEQVREYFETYGPVEEVTFVISKVDMKNKGFGFVTFINETSAQKAVAKHYHEIAGRTIEAKKAQPRERTNKTNYSKMESQQNNQSWQNGPSSYMGSGNGTGPSGGPSMPPSGNPMGSWGMSYGMPGGYMPNSGYGTYGGYGTGYGYGGAMANQMGAPFPSGYPSMGNYHQSSSSYGPSRGSNDAPGYASGRSFDGQSYSTKPSYHPYKR